MGEAKRREELGLPPREKKKEKQTSKNQLKRNLTKVYLTENLNQLKRIYQSKKRDYLGEKKKLLKKRLNLSLIHI